MVLLLEICTIAVRHVVSVVAWYLTLEFCGQLTDNLIFLRAPLPLLF